MTTTRSPSFSESSATVDSCIPQTDSKDSSGLQLASGILASRGILADISARVLDARVLPGHVATARQDERPRDSAADGITAEAEGSAHEGPAA